MEYKSAKEHRQFHVDDINNNMRLRGFEPDPETLEVQRRFVEGEISIMDLLDWAEALMRRYEAEAGQNISHPVNAH